VSFRREAKVPRGGPDGGVGGRGGDVVLLAVSHQNTLLPLRYHTEFRAERGTTAAPATARARTGTPLEVSVPPGTEAREAETGVSLGEVLKDGDRLGGRERAGAAGAATARSSRTRTARRARPRRASPARSAGCGSTSG
jgi:GTP-binding protein